jgi:uncharacterized membrane protein YfcA
VNLEHSRKGTAVPGLGILFGAIVGLSIGLTGGGGALLAVPLLVYGMGLPMPEAVGTSLASVGATALIGFLVRLQRREAEIPTGLIFAASGSLGAPVGAWLAGTLPQALLLMSFAVLMAIVAIVMWSRAESGSAMTKADQLEESGPACRRDSRGALRLTTRCTWLLLVLGFFTGVLSGLFGVGGGFVIVPALVMFSGMPMPMAVGTSLMVVAIVSGSGLAAHLLAERGLQTAATGQFVIGGLLGLAVAQPIARRLSGPRLQRTFAVLILIVAVAVVVKTSLLS